MVRGRAISFAMSGQVGRISDRGWNVGWGRRSWKLGTGISLAAVRPASVSGLQLGWGARPASGTGISLAASGQVGRRAVTGGDGGIGLEVGCQVLL